MSDKKTENAGGFGTFLKNVWAGVMAPKEVISPRRKYIDEFMVVTGALGVLEGTATGSLYIAGAAAAECGIGAGDLARAGKIAQELNSTPK